MEEWLVGQRLLDFFYHVADLGRHGSLRLNPKIFLVFMEGASGVALFQLDIGEEHVRGREIG